MLGLLVFLPSCTKEDTGLITDDSGLDSALLSDRDGDGFEEPEDCDDGDASVNPDAEEVWYDGVDQDCDGRDDDQDLDGFGAATDCDDEDAAVNPDAEEVCDEVDNDCSGGVDDGPDEDGDGFQACDCDDTLAEVNPDGVEVCENGLDDDCDGRLDCPLWGEQSLADAHARVDGGTTHSRGVPADLTGDGQVDILMDDNYLVGDTFTHSVYVVTGPFSGTSTLPDRAHAELVFEGSDVAYATHPDPTGDGTPAMAIGVWEADSLVRVFEAPVEGGLEVGDPVAELHGLTDWDGAFVVDFVDGMTGEAPALLSVRASDAPGGGAVYLLAPEWSEISGLDQASTIVTGDETVGSISRSADGDLDGDGDADLVVAVYKSGAAGVVNVFHGPLGERVQVGGAADVVFEGEYLEFHLGKTIVVPGDVTGDGYVDLMVGDDDANYSTGRAGACLILEGPVTSGSLLDDAAFRFDGGLDNDGLDCAGGVGDLDGDGEADFALTDRFADPEGINNAGAVYVFRGPIVELAGLSDAQGLVLGEEAGSVAGSFVKGAMLDADGLSDLTVTSVGPDSKARVHFLFGGVVPAL